jgi:tRNA threonylcarbamoyladenosine biosynthesis protein TsaE
MNDSTEREFYIHQVSDIPSIAREFLSHIEPRRMIVFDAPMGTGKTTFILELLRQLGIDTPDGSPTYSLVHRYDSQDRGVLYHLDLFRVESLNEAYDIGIEDIWLDYDYCFIEWPEKIESILPDDCIWVYLRILDNGARKITISL